MPKLADTSGSVTLSIAQGRQGITYTILQGVIENIDTRVAEGKQTCSRRPQVNVCAFHFI